MGLTAASSTLIRTWPEPTPTVVRILIFPCTQKLAPKIANFRELAPFFLTFEVTRAWLGFGHGDGVQGHLADGVRRIALLPIGVDPPGLHLARHRHGSENLWDHREK